MQADRSHRSARAVGSEPGQTAAAPAHPTGDTTGMSPHDMPVPDTAAHQSAAAHALGSDQVAALVPTSDAPPAGHDAPPDPHAPSMVSIPLIHVTLATIADTPGSIPFQDSLFAELGPSLSPDLFTPSPALLPLFQRSHPEDHNLVVPAGPAAVHPPQGPGVPTGGAGGGVQSGDLTGGGDFEAGFSVSTSRSGAIFTFVNVFGADTLIGVSGNDSIALIGGDDVIILGTGQETVTTANHAGSELFLVNDPTHFNAADSINGGTGADRIYFADATGGDTLVLNNQITAGSLSIWAADPNGSTAHPYDLGLDAHEVAFGVTLEGNQGSDTLIGGTGADTIVANSTVAGGSEIVGNGGGDSIVSSGHADNIVYLAATDSFSAASASADVHTDVIAGFNDAAATIDFSHLAGAGTEHFTGLKTGASFAIAFAGGAANDVDYAVIAGNTFVDVHQAAGYSASNLVIELQGVHTLTAGNFHLHA